MKTARTLIVAAMFALMLSAAAQSTAPVSANQTEGFGRNQLLVFSYLQNFHCTHEPNSDLDNDGKPAKSDPDEFQQPKCVVGKNVSITPDGKPIAEANKLFVLVPFFDADGDSEAASPELKQALLGLFGFVPDAFDPTPGVDVQCPEPGPSRTERKGAFGTCTMHPSQLDLGPVLAKLGLVPQGSSVVTPTPNHSHVIGAEATDSRWWQIISVLVFDRNAWPDADANRGITSVTELRRAQKAGKAGGDSRTNFFLFFDSKPLESSGQ